MTTKAAQTVIFRQRFAAEHGMTFEDVEKLVKLGNKAGNCGTKECNGDPHRANPNRENKSENARLWHIEGDKVDAQILELIKPYGFSGLDYNGLFPTLVKDGRDVRIPF
jgi:hypothetical protein